MLRALYAVCFLVSVIYSAITFLFSGFSDFFDFDASVDISDGLDLTGLLPIKPFAIIIFLSVFGGSGYIILETGILGNLYILSLIPAAALGFLAAQAVYRYIYLPLARSQKTVKKQNAAIGLEATVRETIIPNGFGKITYRVDNNILSAPAKELTPGNGIKKGEKVLIDSITENIFYVTPISEASSRDRTN